MMYTTPSDIYNVNMGESMGIDFLDYEGSDITMAQMIINNVYSGDWKFCRINDDVVVLAKDTVFDEILNIEKISADLENNTTITCSSMEEAMKIKEEVMKDKNSIDNSMEYMNTLDCVHREKIDSEFIRVTPNIDKPINMAKKEQETMNNVVCSPYGIANIEKISKKSFLIKLFEEGSLFEVYESFIGEVALIELSRNRQEPNIFSMLSETPEMIFHEE